MNKKELSSQFLELPNLITISRFFALPFFVYYYLFKTNYIATILIFAISCITDMLDGYIARSRNMVTQLGTVLDPLVDKVFQLTVAVCIALKGFYAMWVVVAFLLFKDLFLIICGILLYKKFNTVVKANWVGKISSLIFYVAVFVIILFPNYAILYRSIIDFSIILSGVTALVSYIAYGLKFLNSLKHSEKAKN